MCSSFSQEQLTTALPPPPELPQSLHPEHDDTCYDPSTFQNWWKMNFNFSVHLSLEYRSERKKNELMSSYGEMLSPRFEGTPFPMLPPEAQSLYAYNTYTLIIYNIFTHILSFYMKIHLQDHSLQQAFQSRQCFAQNTENREKARYEILF